MSGGMKTGVRAALLVTLSFALLFQGGAAFADPAPTPVTPEPTVSVDAAANADDAGSADASGSSTAAGDSANADSSATSSAETSSEADASAGSEANADASGVDSEGGSTAEASSSAAEADAGADGDDVAAQTDSDADAQADPTPSPTEQSAPTPSDLPDEAIDESLGNERSLRSMAASTSLSSGFNAGYIVSDQNFYNGSGMSTSQIQTFLNQKIGRCTIGDPGRAPGSAWGNTTIAWSCLNGAKWTTSNRASNTYCKAVSGGSQQSSAAIISKIASACGISPQVLLITLEKEQSLISDTWPTARQFDVATGYGCPDTGPNYSANCNPAYLGFPSQVYYAAWQLKVYKANPGNYNYAPYRTNTIQWHPNPGCGTSQVYIENYATAALYIYTPYRPNQAALNAGWGTGDACSSYGNRNFYQFYKAWFGTPNSAFPDVSPSHQFFTEIQWMASTGLSTGIKTSDGRVIYQPKGAVTREAMAAFLYRLEGASYTAPKKSPFADVQPGDKFYREITWMYAKGYSTGIKQNGVLVYAPKNSVSREAMAAFIYRIQGGKYTGPAKSPFADMQRGDKFYNEVTWMYARGYTTGINQGGTRVYAPKSSVSREAMAAFIYRLSR